MKKIYKIPIYITVSLFFAYLIMGPYDYKCYKCGASKTKFTSPRENQISRFVLKITGTPCKHDWKVNSSMMGCSDSFIHREIPLTYDSMLSPTIDAMPNPEWKKSAINALTDEKNLLKWALVLLLKEESMDMLSGNAKSEQEWREWKKNYQCLFVAEYDIGIARKKADPIGKQLIIDYDKLDVYIKAKLNRDLNK